MIDRTSMSVALAGLLALGGGWRTAQVAPQGPAGAVQDSAGPAAPTPPAAWLQGDPADSLYRAAREALDRRDYRHAAELFAQVPTRFPRSGYAADAYYWRAFSLYRVGGTAQLRTALQALDAQRDRFPKAATQGDAKALARRIQGELARQGDPEAAAAVAEAAEAAGRVPPVPPVPPVPASRPLPRPHRHLPSRPMATPAAPTTRTIPSSPRSMRCSRWTTSARGRSSGGCWHGATRPPPASGARRSSSSPRRARTATRTSCSRRHGTIPTPTCASRRCSGCRRWTATARSPRSTRSCGRRRIGRSRRRRSSRCRSTTVRRLRQALRGYAERADLPADAREKAIFWIGQSGGAENEAFLRGLYGRLTDETLRNKVLFSISQAGGAENGRWLLGVARDLKQPIELRKQALFWAGQGNAPIADLAGLYATMPDREMREQLIFVYSQRDEPAAVDKLLDIARREPDKELRKKALFWLGQSSDPRAAKALQDIIEQP